MDMEVAGEVLAWYPATPSKAKLLRAARRLFCNEGVHATGISRIIKEAKVARRTLYESYGSKDNLLRAVFEAESQMWFSWFDADLASGSDDPVSRVLTLFDLLERWFSSVDFYGCIFINAVAEHEKQNGWVRDWAIAHREAVNARLAALVSKTGVLDVALTTEKLSILIDGTIVAAMITRDPHVARNGGAAARDVLREQMRT